MTNKRLCEMDPADLAAALSRASHNQNPEVVAQRKREAEAVEKPCDTE